jgi:hypothetical protein
MDRTSVNDVIFVAVLEGAANLSGEFPGDAFAEAAVGDDVVEHLAAIYEFEDHVVVGGLDDELAHAADVRVEEEHREGGLADGADFLRGILRCLFGKKRGGGRVGGVAAAAWARDDFDSKLEIWELSRRVVEGGRLEGDRSSKREIRITFSPVWLWVASLTLPMLPAPRVFVIV